MDDFAIYRPTTPERAVGLLDARRGPCEVLAGGGDLLDLIGRSVARPTRVVSLAEMPKAFREVTAAGATLRLGAGIRLADLAADSDLRRLAPALAAAAEEIVPPVRNAATLGGNLCQRNRCPYFRDPLAVCLLKGGDSCFAIKGENRRHAIFTGGVRCVLVHPSTLAPVLIALGARAEVLGPKGARTVELSAFFHEPRGPTEREHVLHPDELLVAVVIETAAGRRCAQYGVRAAGDDWPLVQAAAALDLAGGRATNVRVALGQVAATPLLSAAAARAVPLSGNAYKVRLLAVAVRRALLLAAGR